MSSLVGSYIIKKKGESVFVVLREGKLFLVDKALHEVKLSSCEKRTGVFVGP